VYYDFVPTTQDGTTFTSSNTEALVAEVTDARVATVTLVSTGNPDITVAPVAGSVVLPGLKADDLGSRQARIVVRDASGTVLEEVPQEF
jgi:hypothetical protein